MDNVQHILAPERKVVDASFRDDAVLLLAELHCLIVPLRHEGGAGQLDSVPPAMSRNMRFTQQV
eukprot:COSAG06_NODE_52739_length_304_cov_0.668293_1_plen_63_part_10